MINWPSIQQPPINLHNAPEVNTMRNYQPANEHTLSKPGAIIFGMIDAAREPAWIAPGGAVTQDRKTAERWLNYVSRKVQSK